MFLQMVYEFTFMYITLIYGTQFTSRYNIAAKTYNKRLRHILWVNDILVYTANILMVFFLNTMSKANCFAKLIFLSSFHCLK